MGDDIYKGRGTEDESDACHDAGDGWLRDTYAGQEYSVVNEYAEYERTEVAFVGLLWLLLVFLLVLLVLEAMVVSARLTRLRAGAEGQPSKAVRAWRVRGNADSRLQRAGGARGGVGDDPDDCALCGASMGLKQE